MESNLTQTCILRPSIFGELFGNGDGENNSSNMFMYFQVAIAMCGPKSQNFQYHRVTGSPRIFKIDSGPQRLHLGMGLRN